MTHNNFYVDLHCHPTLKSFNSGHPHPTRNMWEKLEHPYTDNSLTRLFRRKSNAIAKESQANLYTMVNGGVRVAVISLYPMEKGFLKFRALPNLIFGSENVDSVLEHITGIALERVTGLQQQENHYFHDLNEEYNYVSQGQGESPDKQYKYKVVSNYGQLDKILKNEPDTIALILSIEGGHALGCGNPVTENMTPDELREELMRNIRQLKSWEHPPFFMNLAHHFWNQLTGHAPSIPFPFNQLINQEKGINNGITDLGWLALNELLGKHNGKRILIDTKHMSVAARKQYYDFISKYNRLNPGDKIPVISSHTGVNGFETLDDSIRVKDHNRKSRRSFLHRRSINISNEEIRIIHESGGILGIMLDKGNLAGFKTLQRLNSIENEAQKTEAWCEVMWANIFQTVKAVGQKTAWDIIGIGTDYDGGISHVDVYKNAESFSSMENDLITYLDKTKMNHNLWHGYQPHELVSKIMRENSVRFFRENFI